MRANIEGLLIDTWWFGLTHRLDEPTFLAFARQRVAEGFNAIQLVVGVPPEVAPAHPDAASECGVAWTLKGQINQDYLQLARRRIGQLNDMGLTVVVYGAWGMQIDWMGVAFMRRWWQMLVDTLDDLDVVYCLTGEVDLWIAMPKLLLPNRSTDDLRGTTPPKANGLRRNLERLAGRAMRFKTRLFKPDAEAHRRRVWGEVLISLSAATQRPILVHPSGLPGAYSHGLIEHSELLAAVTVQTGHGQDSRPLHWQLPLKYLHTEEYRFINLEPWYEGILDNFWAEDQLYAYWCSMLAGACSFAYGAHGVWNVGDGQFLAHWGAQTLAQARALKTPALLGRSHALWLQTLGYDPLARTEYEARGDELLSISRSSTRGCLSFYPDVAACSVESRGELYDPMRGEKLDSLPTEGALLVWQPQSSGA